MNVILHEHELVKTINWPLLFFVLEGAQATGLHHLYFRNYAMVLSHSQLEQLALVLNVNRDGTENLAAHFARVLPKTMNNLMRTVLVDSLETNTALRRQPCAWNMLLNRRCASHVLPNPPCQTRCFSFFVSYQIERECGSHTRVSFHSSTPTE